MFSQSTATKIKAVCLILLLAGSEAARIQNIAQVESTIQAAAKELGSSKAHASDPPESATQAEQAFKEENKKCNWQWSGYKCSGDECKYRPLPMDVTYSQSCRMSDDYMLNNSAEFYPMQTGLLVAKSQKFAKDCTSVSFFNLRASVRCKRRMTHVMRAITFTSKAEVLNKTKGLPKEQVQNAKTSMKESLDLLAGAMGEDGKSVFEVIEKTKKSAAIRQDYKGTLSNATKILWGILMGDDEMKQDARKMMDGMVEADASMPWNLPSAVGSPDKAAHDLENMSASMESFNPSGGVGASFLEKMPSLLQEMQEMGDTSLEESEIHPLLKFIIQVMVFFAVAILTYHIVMEYVFFQLMVPQLQAFTLEAIIIFFIELIQWALNYTFMQNLGYLLGGALGLISAHVVGEALEGDGSSAEVASLRRQQKRAIAREDFALAQRLKQEIDALEK